MVVPDARAYNIENIKGDWFMSEGYFGGEGELLTLASDHTFKSGMMYDAASYDLSGSVQFIDEDTFEATVTQSSSSEVPVGTKFRLDILSVSTTSLILQMQGAANPEVYVSLAERERLAADSFSSGSVNWTNWVIAQGNASYFSAATNSLKINVTHLTPGDGSTSGTIYGRNTRCFNGMSADIALNDVHGNSWGDITCAPIIDGAGNKYSVNFGIQTDNDDVDGVMTAQIRASVSNSNTLENLFNLERAFKGQGQCQNFMIGIDSDNDVVLFYLDGIEYGRYALPSGLHFIPGENVYNASNQNWRNDWVILAGTDQNSSSPETLPMAEYEFDNVQFYASGKSNSSARCAASVRAAALLLVD